MDFNGAMSVGNKAVEELTPELRRMALKEQKCSGRTVGAWFWQKAWVLFQCGRCSVLKSVMSLSMKEARRTLKFENLFNLSKE